MHERCIMLISSARSVLPSFGLGLALLIVACGGSTSSIDPSGSSSGGSSGSSSGSSGSSSGSSGSSSSGASGTTPTTPVPQEEVTLSPPITSLEVTATIISATLGEGDCATGVAPKKGPPAAGDCAPDPDGKGCGGVVCRESNVQLSFKTGAGTKASIEIVSVTLHDATTTATLDTLTANDPRSWTGSTYAPWNETLSPNTDLKASYSLTAPSWSTIASGNTYSAKYRIHVSLKIDGVLVTLQSAVLSREPEVQT